ncbi:hypothetical protein C450_18353 [Halococcus salifodinae DSM 8989]|uniref:Sulfate exporter family transporter n=1 Tax=Halococcus salifodinae DSM 8989 TaxID=1227456 RepID=M0MU38_9EURY|nr:hypothetical protein C450_18353 [Halococcus salifodinae DSM 8989]
MALVVIGLAARTVASVVPSMNYLIVAIVIGIVIANTYGVPSWAQPGVGTHNVWLETGIVVMGASVALDRVLAAGPSILLLVIGTVLATLVVVEALARGVFAIHEETGSLLAAGSSICGVSAVVAIAESIDADETRIAYAAATVLLFDAATLFVYPLVGHVLQLSDTVFGIWAGLTMFSTGPVTAAGFAFSETAGEWALLVKLTRNALIGLAAIGYALHYARRTEGSGVAESVSGGVAHLWKTFPKFVLGFLGVMVVANLGVLGDPAITSLSHASDWAFMLAFAGLGLEIDIDDLRSTGYRPILVVLVGLVAVSTTVLLVVNGLF